MFLVDLVLQSAKLRPERRHIYADLDFPAGAGKVNRQRVRHLFIIALVLFIQYTRAWRGSQELLAGEVEFAAGVRALLVPECMF